jgi:hypothetical protein
MYDNMQKKNDLLKKLQKTVYSDTMEKDLCSFCREVFKAGHCVYVFPCNHRKCLIMKLKILLTIDMISFSSSCRLY